MSIQPANEPATRGAAPSGVELEIAARDRDIGGLVVRRLLPTAARRMVGPFIFFDHMGPVGMAPGAGIDVRPHPHINLATVTYLFEGEIVHRDSLGSEQVIRPGAINWMTAGRGIVHSERSPAAERKAGARVHGLQLWVALPRALEEVEPSFQHHPTGSIPEVDLPGGVRLRILAGEAYGAVSPVAVSSPLHYVEAMLERGARLELPAGVEGRAAYVVEGVVSIEGRPFDAGRMIVFRADLPAVIEAADRGRLVLIGGAPPSTASATSGGTSSRARPSAWSAPRPTGATAAFPRSPATTRSGSRCPSGDAGFVAAAAGAQELPAPADSGGRSCANSSPWARRAGAIQRRSSAFRAWARLVLLAPAHEDDHLRH